MRFLFITTGSHVTVYATAALAKAVRNAGHELLVATNEPLIDAVEAIGVPGVSIMPQPIRHFVTDAGSVDEMVAAGHGLARMAAAALSTLQDLAEDWTPDVIVGSSMSYAAGLLATRLGVPYVRHAEYLQIPMAQIDPAAEEELAPQLKRLSLGGLPDPALLIDVSPPSLRSSPAADAQPMGFVATNPQRRLERWMYTRPTDRPRVLITSGTHHRMLAGSALRHLVEQLTSAGAEVVIAAHAEVAAEFGAEADDVRVGWIPLDVIVPTCDLTVHHGGATTAMTIMTAGAPQLITPPNTHTRAIAGALSAYGAARTIQPHPPEAGRGLAEAMASDSREILADPRYTERARVLAAEIAALPTPADVVRQMEALVTG